MSSPQLDPRRRAGSRLAAFEIGTAGGFSRGRGGALPPDDALMVARPGTERPLTDPPTFGGQTAAEIRQAALSPEFSQALSSGAYLGGWQGAVELSDAMPGGTGTGRAEAMQLAGMRRQKAVWDVANSDEIDAHRYLPEAVTASPQIGMALATHASKGMLPIESHPDHTPAGVEKEWDEDRDQL